MPTATPYDLARDAYGQLNKYQRERVLDLTSQFTNRTSGPEAEAAFVRALEQVTEEANAYASGGFYGGFLP